MSFLESMLNCTHFWNRIQRKRRIRFLTGGKGRSLFSIRSCSNCCFSCCFCCCRPQKRGFDIKLRFLWDGIVSMSAPRMTPENSSYCEIKSLKNSVFSECFQCILRACRGKTACRWRERRYACLIESYQQDEWKNKDFSNQLHAFWELFSFSIIAST